MNNNNKKKGHQIQVFIRLHYETVTKINFQYYLRKKKKINIKKIAT